MPNGLVDLPLFPLETVLFPHAELRLHIFEDRYCQMVRDCIENRTRFGIVLIRTGQVVGGPAEPFMVGSMVDIESMHAYPDDKMDIQVRAVARFRIRKLDESNPLLRGLVEVIEDAPIEPSERLDNLMATAKESFEELVRRLFREQDVVVKVEFPDDPVELSFTIANLIHLENREKQLLLETTDTEERLEKLAPLLTEQLEAAQDATTFQLIEASRVRRTSHEELKEWSGPN